MYRIANCSASFTSSARCKDTETIKLIEKICLSNQTRSYRQSTFILLAGRAHQLAGAAGCHADLPKGELPHGGGQILVLLGRDSGLHGRPVALDDVLVVICCALNKRYLSIHVGSSSMDDEPAVEVCDRRRCRSDEWVNDNMATVTVLKGGDGDGLEGGSGDGARGRRRRRGSWGAGRTGLARCRLGFEELSALGTHRWLLIWGFLSNG
jgi:hypothetical protein